MNKYIQLIAAVVMLSACENNIVQIDEPNQGTDVPGYAEEGTIQFEVDQIALTRAPGEMTLDGAGSTLKLQDSGFGVFGFYTGKVKYNLSTVTPDFMYNQKVEWKDDGAGNLAWLYDPVKYWPNAFIDGTQYEYVSFFTYAPYVNHAALPTEGIIGMSLKDDKGDPWIAYKLAEKPWGDPLDATVPKQVDLLFGMKKDGTNYVPYIDQHKNDYGDHDKMTIYFKHALACIGDKITIQMSEDLYNIINGYATVTLDKVVLEFKNLTTKGRLVLNSADGTANWKEVISGELTTDRKLTLDKDNTDLITASGYTFTNTTAQTLSEGLGLFYIPMQIAGTEKAKCEVTAYYTVENNAGSKYEGTAKDVFDLDLDIEGKKQGIALTLSKDFDLSHLVYSLGSGAGSGPSYAPRR